MGALAVLAVAGGASQATTPAALSVTPNLNAGLPTASTLAASDTHLLGRPGPAWIVEPVPRLRAADASAESCTMGDALAMFEAFHVPTHVMRPRGIEAPKLLDTLARCQYRLFRHGATFTFSELDTVLGGILWLYDYDNLGRTRGEAIADLESIQDRVWLAELLPGGVTGAWVERPLMRTAYKNVESAVLGLSVLQHRAFITRLPPGEYLSYWTSSSPGVPDVTATVRLVITPAGSLGSENGW